MTDIEENWTMVQRYAPKGTNGCWKFSSVEFKEDLGYFPRFVIVMIAGKV